MQLWWRTFEIFCGTLCARHGIAVALVSHQASLESIDYMAFEASEVRFDADEQFLGGNHYARGLM